MDAPKVLYLHIPDTHSLHKHYMSFLKGGGLFLPTAGLYAMGEQLFILLELPDTLEPHAVVSKVVWITPAGAQNKRVRGVGMQFLEEESRVKLRIENLLAEMIDDAMQTLTL